MVIKNLGPRFHSIRKSDQHFTLKFSMNLLTGIGDDASGIAHPEL